MENHCKMIAITKQKGGVGKTTTTLNLGVGLANEGKSVLLIDADPQGSLTVSLGTSSRDIFFEAPLVISGKNPYAIDEHTTLGEIMANPAAMAVLGQFLPGAVDRIGSMTEDMKKFMAPEEIGPLLKKQMIHFTSDAAQLQGGWT